MHLSVNDGKWPESCIAVENLHRTGAMVNPKLAILDYKVLPGNSSSHEICEQYPSVLIDVRKFIQRPEDAFVEVLPQMVGLQTLNLCNRVWGHSIKPMSPNLLFEKFNSATDREHIFFGGLAVRSKDKFPY